MPVRVRAKPPGEFIRDHLVEVGGVDYPQSIHRAYKAYLKSQGIKNGTCRDTMSTYLWRARQMGLIVFDHADVPAYWDGIPDGVEVPENYIPEPRPLAPSPRHYYRITDSADPRWVRLEASYRESIGIEVPPPFPRVPIRPAPPPEGEPPKKVRKPKVIKPPVAKPPAPPKVPKPKKPTLQERLAPFEEGMAVIADKLEDIERAPTLEKTDEFDEELIILGEAVVSAAEKARGAERSALGGISSRIRATFDHRNLLRSSVERTLASRTAAERERAGAALRAAIRVVGEDLVPVEEEGGE